ncbi:hypothetical protein AB0754_01115 [Streptococcus dysgalactiae subsp. equisimilis]|uniref:Transposase n=1 Tax=Streptococcus dysgalactiae subsp. equisimilis TaxID=119602 RepID=A0AB38Y1P3_STREQ|nr:hypothetical protein [Streptococcus dysgalactiae]WHM79340.1 hypothetical protein OPT59_01100 [Streptococcus dysgalactiae subsp. equisimilis]WJD52432.1 hypothetical protein QRS93_01035 [Streptococcus dysgalactiae subsp. equisimilis]
MVFFIDSQILSKETPFIRLTIGQLPDLHINKYGQSEHESSTLITHLSILF